MICTQLTPEIPANNAFNVCTIAVDRVANQFLAASVYRAPWEISADMKTLYKILDDIVVKYKIIFILGDFNLSRAQLSVSTSETDILSRSAHEHCLRQLASSPSHRAALLDLKLHFVQFRKL